MFNKGMSLTDEDGAQHVIQEILWQAKDVEAFLTTSGHIVVIYKVPKNLRNVYLERFYLLAHIRSIVPVLLPEAILAAPYTGYITTPIKNMHRWMEDVKPTEMSLEDYEDWIVERGGLMARYETANSLLQGLMTLHREGYVLGTLRPEELGIEDGTHNVVFLRADGLMHLSAWHNEVSAHNTLEENPYVLPLLRSLLFPWPLVEQQEISLVDNAGEDRDEAEDVAHVEAYLTDEMHTLLFPEQASDREPAAPVSLSTLRTACQRAMRQLQCCPSCETWYFANIGQTNECPTCGWPEESMPGARLCIQIKPSITLFFTNDESQGGTIDLPMHSWLFFQGKQQLDIRPFLPQALPIDVLAPLVSVELRTDGTIWLVNETQKPILHELKTKGNDLVWPEEDPIMLTRHESRIEFPELPLSIDGEEVARTKVWMEIE